MAVTLSLFAGAGAQFFDNNGNVLSGGKIYTYFAGTTTPLAAYTSNNGSVFHTNPIILDSAGRVPSGGEIWLQLGIGYKFVLKTSTDVLIATYDNIPSSAQPPAVNDADSILYEQGYTVTAGSFVVGRIYRIASIGTTNFTLIGAVNNIVGTHFIATGVGTGTGTAELSQTVETKLRETVSVKDFGAVGDGVTNDTVAIYNAIQHINALGGGTLVFEPGATYSVLWLWDSYPALGVRFQDCKGVRLIGNGCTIEIRDGARCGIHDGVFKDEGYGFFFRQCEDVEVTGFLWDGNKANVNYGTTDGNCIGLFLQSNKRVSVRNCTFKKFATDGGLTNDGPLEINNEDLFFENVVFDGGRRQAFSACGQVRTTYVNCQFINTGDDGIGTAPQSGFDFEPIAPARTDDTTLINCLFKNNGNTQMVADSGQNFVKNALFYGCIFDCDTATNSKAAWTKNDSFVFRDCKFFGQVIFPYGKFYNCDVTMTATNDGGYAIDHNTDNVGMLWEGGTITVSGGKRVYNLQGALASEDERKILSGVNINLDGTLLSSGDFWAIHRAALLRDTNIFLSGTLPASPFYLNSTLGLALNCESFSASLTLGTTSATVRPAWGGLTPLRLSQPGALDSLGVVIAAGVITVTGSLQRVDTEASASTDDLDTINGGYPYQRLILFALNAARTVVVKNNTGNILLDGATDKTLDNSVDMLELMYEPVADKWVQLSFSNNGA